MPISIALLLCIPIGFLAYFEARWLIRYLFGRYESRERKAALICGFFGASLIPLLYCFGYIEQEFPGRIGENLAMGFFMIGSWAFAGPVIAILRKGKQKTLSAVIDLRSDTVTRPTLEMRAAMAAAEVGDDVYGEDPTVNLLERRAAEVFGREAALFVPTGTMGNQIAIRLLTQPGQEVIAESRAHILDWEMATTAVFSGCLVRAVPAERGILTWQHIEPAIYARGAFRAATGLIEIENTANLAGGGCTPVAVLEEIWAGAKERKLPTHLDGARIFNAAVALGVDVKALTRGFDTVMFCLSKGLGAPVGSMLTGSAELMDRARLYRKALGGGMRQVGILAAAGLIALEQGPGRLHEDHANARMLAEALAGLDGVSIDLDAAETNIVVFRVTGKKSAAEVAAGLKARGVLVSALGGNLIRLVTHLDVDRAACVAASEALVEEIEAA